MRLCPPCHPGPSARNPAVRSQTVSDEDLVERLRTGDERAFAELVSTYQQPLVRLALTFVPSRAVAEEVVQETFIGVIRGIGRFEGRSSLRTWIYRILVNRARTTGAREPRHMSLGEERDVLAGRFSANGVWTDPPSPWPDDVDERLAAPELARRLLAAIEGLPGLQRQVVTLRDVEGLSSAEVCELLEISDGNQRVLLHRARTKLRAMFEDELAEERRS
jgi:RNA polymerase sigma-70 factor (ECF subfamily)